MLGCLNTPPKATRVDAPPPRPRQFDHDAQQLGNSLCYALAEPHDLCVDQRHSLGYWLPHAVPHGYPDHDDLSLALGLWDGNAVALQHPLGDGLCDDLRTGHGQLNSNVECHWDAEPHTDRIADAKPDAVGVFVVERKRIAHGLAKREPFRHADNDGYAEPFRLRQRGVYAKRFCHSLGAPDDVADSDPELIGHAERESDALCDCVAHAVCNALGHADRKWHWHAVGDGYRKHDADELCDTLGHAVRHSHPIGDGHAQCIADGDTEPDAERLFHAEQHCIGCADWLGVWNWQWIA